MPRAGEGPRGAAAWPLCTAAGGIAGAVSSQFLSFEEEPDISCLYEKSIDFCVWILSVGNEYNNA